jgi:hypothetical protein
LEEICEILRFAADAIEQLAYDGKDAMRLRRKLMGAQNAVESTRQQLRALQNRHASVMHQIRRGGITE